jgi:hypothetical protein
VPDRHRDPVRHQLSCRGHGLLAVTVVVDVIDDDLLAEHPAGRVQLGDGQVGAILHFLTGEPHLPGQRSREADQDLGGEIMRFRKRRERDRSEEETARPSARNFRPPQLFGSVVQASRDFVQPMSSWLDLCAHPVPPASAQSQPRRARLAASSRACTF